MPSLSVTEKEHWKDRIGRRIDKKIETLKSSEPNLMDRIEREARQRALTSLGLADLQAELDRLTEQRETLQLRERQVEREKLATIRCVPVDSIAVYYSGSHEVDSAIKCRQVVYVDELLAESELGRRILKLREEREELLDTVWLATSPAQVRELWTKVAELLGEEQTQLQRDALAIPAVTD